MVKAYFMPSGRPWKIDESGKRIRVAAVAAAENDDERMDVDEHPQVAAHHDERDQDNAAGDETEAVAISMKTPNRTRARRTPGGIEVP